MHIVHILENIKYGWYPLRHHGDHKREEEIKETILKIQNIPKDASLYFCWPKKKRKIYSYAQINRGAYQKHWQKKKITLLMKLDLPTLGYPQSRRVLVFGSIVGKRERCWRTKTASTNMFMTSDVLHILKLYDIASHCVYLVLDIPDFVSVSLRWCTCVQVLLSLTACSGTVSRHTSSDAHSLLRHYIQTHTFYLISLPFQRLSVNKIKNII